MRLTKNILSLLFLVFIAFSQTARALDNWPPSFSKDTIVYLGHALNSEETTYFQDAKFQAEIKRLASQEQLDIFVIVTRTDDNSLAANNTGPTLVRNLMESWGLQGTFPEARSLIILLTGPKEGPLVSSGVRAGSYLNDLGITRNVLNDPGGPVKGAIKDYLSSDPRKAVLNIIANINVLADKHIHDMEAASAEETTEGTAQHQAGVKKEAEYGAAAIAAISLVILFTGGFLVYLLVSNAEHAAHPDAEKDDELKPKGNDKKEA